MSTNEQWLDAFRLAIAEAHDEAYYEARENELRRSRGETVTFYWECIVTEWTIALNCLIAKMRSGEREKSQLQIGDTEQVIRNQVADFIASKMHVAIGLPDALRNDEPGYLINWVGETGESYD